MDLSKFRNAGLLLLLLAGGCDPTATPTSPLVDSGTGGSSGQPLCASLVGTWHVKTLGGPAVADLNAPPSDFDVDIETGSNGMFVTNLGQTTSPPCPGVDSVPPPTRTITSPDSCHITLETHGGHCENDIPVRELYQLSVDTHRRTDGTFAGTLGYWNEPTGDPRTVTLEPYLVQITK